ncbi:MAG: InlB B-repeat-containing protein [Coriobacteriales bacterium]|jgi:uncharacterized repeat protein (TIGR02543 family)|nr:InlB B-repeat-containing protein [Coriobacteriales bacterium]
MTGRHESKFTKQMEITDEFKAWLRKFLPIALSAVLVIWLFPLASFADEAEQSVSDSQESGDSNTPVVQEDTPSPTAEPDTETVAAVVQTDQVGNVDGGSGDELSTEAEASAEDVEAEVEAEEGSELETLSTDQAEVADFEELKAALANSEVETINFTTSSIVMPATLGINREVTLNGAAGGTVLYSAKSTSPYYYGDSAGCAFWISGGPINFNNVVIDGSQDGTLYTGVKIAGNVIANGLTICNANTGVKIVGAPTMVLNNASLYGNQTAIHVEGGATVTLNSCVLRDNINTTTAAGGYWWNAVGGGIFSVDPANFYLYNSQFINNDCVNGSGGGAVSVLDNGDLIIDGCSFSGNDTAGGGGAIYVGGGSRNFQITNSSFSANTAGSYGGAIRSNSPTNINNASFNSNSTGQFGGAIYCSSDLFMSHCSLAGNGSNNQAGAIYSGRAQSVQISDCSFTGNWASGYYGAIQFAYDPQITLERTTFTSNSSGYYGAVGASFGSGSLTITDCAFNANSAVDCAGALSVGDVSAFSMTGTSFSGNTASWGGAILVWKYASDSVNSISGCVFDNNSAVYNGGAVYLSSGETTYFSNVSFAGNSQTSVDDDGDASDVNGGGAIYACDLADVHTEGCTFTNNSAASVYGGSLDAADAALHEANIQATSYSVPFAHAYNNADINYLGEIGQWVALSYQRNYHSDDMESHFGGFAQVGDPFPALLAAWDIEELGWQRENYEFVGWTLDAAGVEPFSAPESFGETGVVLYAQWREVVPEQPEQPQAELFTVTFVDWDGTVLKLEDNIPYGSAATAPEQPTRSGYSFSGWDTAYDNVVADLTVTAVYEAESVIQPADDTPLVVTPPAVIVNPPAVNITQTTPATTVLSDVPTPEAVVAAAEEQDIPVANIGEAEIPLIAPSGIDSWAFANLVIAVSGMLISIVAIVGYFFRTRRQSLQRATCKGTEVEVCETVRKRMFWRIACLALAAVAVVLFVATEDISLPMVLADRWTLVHLIIVAAQLTLMGLGLRLARRQGDEDGHYLVEAAENAGV